MLLTTEGGGLEGSSYEFKAAKKEAGQVVANYPEERVIAIMSESGIGDFSEASYVAHSVLVHLRNARDIIPAVTRHRGFDLASRCLVSLGFFLGYMQHLTDNHGYPSPEFYTNAGKQAFVEEGRRDVSEHFEGWTGYMHYRFEVKHEKSEKGLVTPVVYEKVKYHKTFPVSGTWKREGELKSRYELGHLADNSPETDFDSLGRIDN